jgi:hypothetical protein
MTAAYYVKHRMENDISKRKTVIYAVGQNP